MKRVVFLACLLASFGSPLHANPSAVEILKRVDDYNNAPKDWEYAVDMVVKEASGEEKPRKMILYQRGDSQRLIRFTAPADVKGMTILMEDKGKIYIYLPTYKKIRRVSVSNLKQTFLGSDFTFDDMNLTRFLDYYDPELIEETPQEYILLLKRKPQAKGGDPALKVWVLKEKPFVTRLEHLDEAGNVERIETREGFKVVQGREVQTVIRMVTVKTGHETTQYVGDIKFDQGLPASFFSRRNLVKRR
ncbi:MAG: outer membrane lipoprotein-sorting protein [Deltaproteobacteria bacterium]|nr:MAG: outer membrane lipoprotein-sorting protein [Deltaproteobacteria bacterium]